MIRDQDGTNSSGRFHVGKCLWPPRRKAKITSRIKSTIKFTVLGIYRGKAGHGGDQGFPIQKLSFVYIHYPTFPLALFPTIRNVDKSTACFRRNFTFIFEATVVYLLRDDVANNEGHTIWIQNREKNEHWIPRKRARFCKWRSSKTPCRDRISFCPYGSRWSTGNERCFLKEGSIIVLSRDSYISVK